MSTRRPSSRSRSPALPTTFAALVLLATLGGGPAQGASDRRPLATLLGEAAIAVPPNPFPAPSFSLPDVAGGTVDLGRLRGRVVVLYFWTTW